MDSKAALSNATLFRRDHYRCLYCGLGFLASELSRDHVHPVSRGGQDEWMNVVTACKRCNTRKGNRLLAESSLSLLALPYRPNHAEYLALTHSGRILGDQMTFLQNQFSANSRHLLRADSVI
jgi:5-methylcytosine-specific restriction endonuclease McrA